MLRKALTCLLTIAALAISDDVARADFTTRAIDNATIQPGGPRSGINGKRFFNIEGSDNGSFASFGVIDFRAPVESTSLVTSLTLTLFQSNAGFTRNGSLNFFLTQDTTTNIQPGTSPLRFMAGSANDGIGAQLAPLTLLGPGTFTQVSNGTADTFTFAVPTSVQPFLGQQVSTGGLIRIVIAATTTGTAATFGGGDNFNGAPTLTGITGGVAAVPEPASLVLMGLGVVGIVGVARRRTSKIA